jgi:hypothetical protein
MVIATKVIGMYIILKTIEVKVTSRGFILYAIARLAAAGANDV